MVTKDRLAELQLRMSLPYGSRSQQDESQSYTTFTNDDVENDQIQYAEFTRMEDSDDEDQEGEIFRMRLMSNSTWLALEIFLIKSSQLHQEIHLLESYVEDVKLKHSQLLVSPHEDKKTKHELDAVLEAFNQLSQKVRKTIKEMEERFENSKQKNINTSDEVQQKLINQSHADNRIRENQLAALNRRLLKVLRAYNEEQVRYRECCKERIKGYIDLTGKRIDEDELDEIIESGNLYSQLAGIFIDEGKTKQMLQDIEARHADIIRLEASVRELRQIFQDMALLVEEQGEKIDHIEFNVQLAVEYTERAKKQIKLAVAHKDRYRRESKMNKTIYRFARAASIRRYFGTKLTDLDGPRSTKPGESLETKRARLLYQSTKRGILENDLILGGFSREQLKHLSPTQLETYEKLVNGGLNEWDIYYWIIGTKSTPAEYETDVMEMLRNYALTNRKLYDHKVEKV